MKRSSCCDGLREAGWSAIWLSLLFTVTALAAAPIITIPPASQTIFLGDAVTFSVGASGTAPLSYQWFRNGTAVSGAKTNSLVFMTAAPDNNAEFTVQVTNTSGAVTSSPAALTIDFGLAGPTQTNRLLEITNVWRYNVSGTDLGTNWVAAGYSDSAWPSGGGLLYVEDAAMPAPKTTALPLTAGSLPTTCYFRTPFTNDLANAYSLSLVANTVIDDGVVCYLNGAEAFRLGMPDGIITYDTLASRRVGDAVWEGPFDVSTTNLVAGTNVLAAEVHQAAADSTDIVMGLTLDAVWQARLRDTNPPIVTDVIPTAGGTVATLTQIEVQFSEPVRGVDAADLRISGVPATNVTVVAPQDYIFQFPSPATGVVSVTWAPGHEITDCSANSNAFAGTGFGYVLAPAVSSATSLSFFSIVQSTDASSANGALRAVDGSSATFSLTADLPGSYWLADLGRPYPLERIEIVNRPAPGDTELAGQALHLFNMDDQVVFQTSLTNPGSGGTAIVSLPAGTLARSVWIGLPGSQTNGAGNHRVGLAEVRAFGLPDLPYGPAPVPAVTNAFTVAQSSEFGGYPAANAVDGVTGDFSHTANLANSYWIADLQSSKPITRVEVVNRTDCCDNRLAGLILRILNAASNSVASVTLTNPGPGGTYIFIPPNGTAGRYIKIGLENNQTNGGGNYYVTLAEVRAYSGTTNWLAAAGSTPVAVTNNLASFKRSYMVRLTQSIPAASNANDDNYSTETKTTTQTVDGYWEVDLGATYALYGVRTIGASGIGYRMTNTICRLFNEAHDSVFARKLTGGPDVFDTDLNGPVFARYVRVGLEDKQRTDPAGGLEWYIGMREVEAFGRPTNNVGILSFAASTNLVAAGENVTLTWAVSDVRRVEIHPAIGSVGAYTATNGVGSLTVAVTNSTEFMLVASNATGFFSRAVSVQVASNALSVRISEIVADNKYSLMDGYGVASDWIELRNCGNAPVDLAGWGLSDDAAQPMKWIFPATNIAPHSTLVVFASGNGTPFDPAGNLQASFRLNKQGGALLLTASDGLTVVDRLAAYPALDTDLAYGGDLEGNWTFMEPTPGAINTGVTYAGWLKPLSFSHSRGFYQAPFTLTITNNNAGAGVFYSLNGTVPSVPYINGIAITGTKSVRAQVVRPGYKSARNQTRTFIFVNDVITSSVMNTAITQNPSYAPRMKPGLLALPAISLVVPSTITYDEQEGSIEVLWPSGADAVQENCGIYRYGGSWEAFAKASITVAFRSRYGNGKLQAPLFNGFDHGVLAKTSFDKLELNAGNQDMYERGFYMADRFVQDSLLDMGDLNPHGRFVHVYLNGVYWGQYHCKEVLMENFMADYLGGTADDYLSVKGNDNVGDNFVVGTPDAPNTQPWERVLSLRNSYTGVRPYLDVTHLVDFMLLWNYGDCESEFRACGPREAGSGFKFWMADSDGFLRTDALGLNRTVNNGPGDLFSGLVGEGHSDFKMLMADRIYRHLFNQGALTPAANDARLAARMLEIHDSLLAECARWGYQTPANWESSAATIRSRLFPTRTSQLVGYLRAAGLYPAFDPPAFNQYGGLATNGFQPTISSSSGTIYYTLDGSDPRLAGGGIAPQARVWTPGAVTITNDLTLNVRVRTSAGQWSALAQPSFLLASRRPPTARDLLVTEINYNPAGLGDYEFIELYNAGTNLLDLSGVSLSNAVRYIFPAGYALGPGAFAVVVKDTAAFAQRYQAPGTPYYWPRIDVVGPWAGSLDNAGETVSLVASNGVELSSVPYKPGGDWPVRADGQGSSLELIALPPPTATDQQVRAFVADGRNWSASSLYHGSPGRFDTFLTSVRINEVLTHTGLTNDWLELLNTDSQPVGLAGCTLTDNMDQPNRWAFPTNTVLQPGQFLVLSSPQLGFGFSKLGESAYLLQLAGTNILRFLDSVDFPAAEREESFGRFQRSDGQVDFTELRANTPGAPNALPRVGPVVISEIMAIPLPGQAQFVELTSITNGPVPLFDPLRPTNVWMLDGVGGFAFPTGTVLQACSSVIVCSTNPAAFRAQYGVSSAVPVFGPWSGVLDDDGETLKLLRPGDPEPDGTVPYYRVDHVSYRTAWPWPPASAELSLERIPLEAYGNDPAYWRAGPSGGSPGVTAANRLPIITVTGNLVVPQASPLTLTLAAADLDVPWQTVTLSPTELPAGSRFDPASGTLAWTPSAAQGPGDFTVQFVATDTAACGPNQASLQFVIHVTAPLVLTAQYLADTLQLSFPALSGETYRVEYCEDLALGNWVLLQEVTAAQAGSATILDTIPPGSPARFYRVLWVR
jgi:hypothetical protein